MPADNMKIDIDDPLNYAGGLRHVKLSDQIYDRIFGLIVSGEFPEKSKLPTEVELADRLDVSRTIVREALARLRDEGFVVSRQGSGTFVQRQQPEKAVAGFQPVGSIADVHRCFEFRVGLEGEAAYHAALRKDARDTGEIERTLEALETIVKQGKVGAVADFEFHYAVARATGNPFYASAIALLRPHIDFGMNLARSLSLRKPRSRVRQVQDEHARVYLAIQEGDAEKAREAMRYHIENACTRLFEGEAG
ncbi:MAG TPA: FadR/GntR family transcriptional regulator [Xanthobacteraceae bacterium]|jgi:DNA-binding FadR family transcriptional regulator|nr:FadR/GntR family transcriptional regulator [Xanthobacteraceae bacterium]